MKQGTNITSETAPLFTTRDTCIGLAACMGIGLLTSIMLSAIILVLAATSSVQANDATITETLLDNERLMIPSRYSPEDVISQNCDARIGELRNITVGDKLSFLNEAENRQYFRVTGIQAVEAKPEVMPVVDDTSMLTIVTCYTAGHSESISYLIMIQELDLAAAGAVRELPRI